MTAIASSPCPWAPIRHAITSSLLPHLYIAFSGSPLPSTEIHILGLAFEASHHQPPLAVIFLRTVPLQRQDMGGAASVTQERNRGVGFVLCGGLGGNGTIVICQMF